ncbi:transglutaminase family protein [Bacteroidales bacterium AH-315-I05]|nr:transglutaminase family protein [Bacteroidales bacterium AH-315-I05]
MKTSSNTDFEQYLQPATYTDSDHPSVVEYAETTTSGIKDKNEKAVALYYKIRDGYKYDPYRVDLNEQAMKASDLLTRDHGYCIEKANLLAATCRVVGIPSRLHFANVRNHIGTEKLEKGLKTNVLVFHGYTEMYLNGKWVKATPAFNKSLCEMLHVEPLEFDGKNDSIFQEYDKKGAHFMEYLHDYGHFDDVPRELFIQELKKHYPHLFEKGAIEGMDSSLFIKG